MESIVRSDEKNPVYIFAWARVFIKQTSKAAKKKDSVEINIDYDHQTVSLVESSSVFLT